MGGVEPEAAYAMPFVILTVAIQVIAVVHLFRTGRNMRWLFLIILVPMVGCLAYFIVEVLPSLRQSPRRARALRRAQNAIDPEPRLARRLAELRAQPKHRDRGASSPAS